MLPLAAEMIQFPHLGWTFSVDPVLAKFDLFGSTVSIRWYGVMIAVGFLLAILYGMKRARSLGADPDRLLDVVLVATIGAFVAARLYYVAFHGNWSEVLAVWKGGLAIYGGLIGGLAVGLLMCKVCKLRARPLLDLAALGFLIGQGIGRWGNFFNQEAFGGNTDLLWGMTGSIIQAGTNGAGYDPALPVHPTFLYESLWCLLGFLVLHLISKKCYRFSGQIFALYLIWYGAERAVLEGLRTDSLMWGNLRVSQWVSVAAVALGIVLFGVWRKRGIVSADARPVKEAADEPPVSTLGIEMTASDETPEDAEAADDTAPELPEQPEQPEPPEPASKPIPPVKPTKPIKPVDPVDPVN